MSDERVSRARGDLRKLTVVASKLITPEHGLEKEICFCQPRAANVTYAQERNSFRRNTLGLSHLLDEESGPNQSFRDPHDV